MISTKQHVEASAPALNDLDFHDPAFLANPFPALARLRATAPVHPISLPEGRRAWLVTRFEDATRIFKDPHVSTVAPPDHASVPRAPSILRLTWPSMLETDPPDHARLR